MSTRLSSLDSEIFFLQISWPEYKKRFVVAEKMQVDEKGEPVEREGTEFLLSVL